MAPDGALKNPSQFREMIKYEKVRYVKEVTFKAHAAHRRCSASIYLLIGSSIILYFVWFLASVVRFFYAHSK